MINLYTAFANIKTKQEFDAFITDLCTPEEIRFLSERWNIAQLLYGKNLSQEAISKKLNCARATITRVSRCLNENQVNGYRTVLGRVTYTKK